MHDALPGLHEHAWLLLTAGPGADAFRFLAAADGGDTIRGFTGALDDIEVSATGFGTGLVEGMDLASEDRFATSATGQGTVAGLGQFVWQGSARMLWWDADGAGGADAVMLARLPVPPVLAARDIVIIA